MGRGHLGFGGGNSGAGGGLEAAMGLFGSVFVFEFLDYLLYLEILAGGDHALKEHSEVGRSGAEKR